MRRLFYTLENVLAIAVVVAKRLRHHLGLSVSTLVGIISVLSLVICVPVFTNAVLSQVLKQTLIDKSVSNHHSLFSLYVDYQDVSTNTFLTAQGADTVTSWINQQLTQKMGLKVANIFARITHRGVRFQTGQVPIQQTALCHYPHVHCEHQPGPGENQAGGRRLADDRRGGGHGDRPGSSRHRRRVTPMTIFSTWAMFYRRIT